MSDSIERDLYLGFIRLHILHHAAKGPIYGKAFRDELAGHGYGLSYGTLYPIFYGLEKAGYIESSLSADKGGKRRLYVTTQLGRAALLLATKRAKELMMELEEL